VLHVKVPAQRWGHTSVAAHMKMFILGGYQGNNNQPNPHPTTANVLPQRNLMPQPFGALENSE